MIIASGWLLKRKTLDAHIMQLRSTVDGRRSSVQSALREPLPAAHLVECKSIAVSCATLIFLHTLPTLWAGKRSRYSDCLRAGLSGDRIPVGARFSAPVQTGPEAHPPSCTMGTGSFPGVRCRRGVTLTPHPLLVQRSKIE